MSGVDVQSWPCLASDRSVYSYSNPSPHVYLFSFPYTHTPSTVIILTPMYRSSGVVHAACHFYRQVLSLEPENNTPQVLLSDSSLDILQFSLFSI